jgi:cytoskeleton protein RodZ
VTPPPAPAPAKAASVPPKPASAPPKAPPAPATDPKAAATPPQTLVAGEGPAHLKFRFHGDSWVEIRDSRGKVILSKLNPAGSEAEVAGQPPLKVIVGNAPEVQLYYNDREFDLESHTNVAVARFTVE